MLTGYMQDNPGPVPKYLPDLKMGYYHRCTTIARSDAELFRDLTDHYAELGWSQGDTGAGDRRIQQCAKV